jgi:predicted GNAT family acetyltransferase
VKVIAPAGAAPFLDLAMPLLTADEAANCLPIGIATGLRDEPGLYETQQFWVVLAGDAPVGAALRTGSHFLVLAREGRHGAVELLAESIEAIPGVTGPRPEVERFAAAWTERWGGIETVRTSQAIHVLETLSPVAAVPGAMTAAGHEDCDLLVDWVAAFAVEALAEDPPRQRHRTWVEHRLASGDGGLVLWKDADGRPVSFAGFGGSTPNGIRIGPVYTPPTERGNGYASALVSALSGRLLLTRRFCFLFTDLANPTSNRIYARLGYRQVCRADEIAFS